MDKGMEAGADAIIASHSHMVQQAEMRGSVPCMYCLGNFNMSPLSSLYIEQYHPDYGLAAHLYVEDKKIVKTTFSIMKIVETKGSQVAAWPVDEYAKTLKDQQAKDALEKDVQWVYKMVTGQKLEENVIRREYLLG